MERHLIHNHQTLNSLFVQTTTSRIVDSRPETRKSHLELWQVKFWDYNSIARSKLYYFCYPSCRAKGVFSSARTLIFLWFSLPVIQCLDLSNHHQDLPLSNTRINTGLFNTPGLLLFLLTRQKPPLQEILLFLLPQLRHKSLKVKNPRRNLLRPWKSNKQG